MNCKKTLVLGASPNPDRYSHQAVVKLDTYGHSVAAIGAKQGNIGAVEIHDKKLNFKEIDTVSIYLSAKNQENYQDYILSLKPKRVIFNPGAENDNFQRILQTKNIEAIEACTLVMLSIGNY